MGLPKLNPGATTAEVQQACLVLERMLQNVLEHPLQAKYRTINTAAASFSVVFQAFDPAEVMRWLLTDLASTRIDDGPKVTLGGAQLGCAVHDPTSPSATSGLTETLSGPLQNVLVRCEECLSEVRRLRLAGPAFLVYETAASASAQRSAGAPASNNNSAEAAVPRLTESTSRECVHALRHAIARDGGVGSVSAEDWRWLRSRLVIDAPSGHRHAAKDERPSDERLARWYDDVVAVDGCSTEGRDVIRGITPEHFAELEDKLLLLPSATEPAARMAAARSRTAYLKSLPPPSTSGANIPHELRHTATSLIADIGGLMELYALATQQLRESAGAGSRGGRMCLVREDRFEMQRLQEAFNLDGDIMRLHALKAAWEEKLEQLERSAPSGELLLFHDS